MRSGCMLLPCLLLYRRIIHHLTTRSDEEPHGYLDERKN